MSRFVGGMLLLAVGCQGGPIDPPRVEAHRAAAGYWPENSAAAVHGCIAADFDGIEIDLVLTADGEAVLNHAPWLEPGRCTLADGTALDGRVRIADFRLEDLQADFVCGGQPDPEHPAAEVLPEPILSFDEFLAALDDAPASQRIHLDWKVEPPETAPVDDWLEPVLDRWWAADRPQRLVVSANTPEALLAAEDHARAQGRALHTLLIFPFAASGADPNAVGLGVERDTLLGKVDYVDQIEAAGADGIAVNWEIAEKGQVIRASRAGYEVALWTLNEPRLLERYSRWPVDTLITDYPGSAP